MKILVLNHEFPPVGGGASPVCFDLCSHLAKLGHHVDVVTMHYKDTQRFEQINGFNVYRTAAIRKRPDICHTHELATYVPGAFFKTLKLARKNKYDVIHCHFVVPGGILAYLISKLTGIPYVITCHGSDVPGHNPERFILLHKMIKPFWVFLVSRAKAITAPSKFLASKIVSLAQKANVQVIPNGIDAERFNRSVQKKKKILLCSRILKFKGFQYFIEAIKDMELDWEIDIIGDGPYLSELKDMAKDCKTKIKFHGWLDKNSKKYTNLFSESSIFVFPSKAESFGMVTAEAMAAGCAVIASDISSHKEVLKDAGIFVPIENSDSIRRELKNIIENYAQRIELQDKASQLASEYNWNNLSQKFVDLYQRYK